VRPVREQQHAGRVDRRQRRRQLVLDAVLAQQVHQPLQSSAPADTARGTFKFGCMSK
jgi:hypothetical protein